VNQSGPDWPSPQDWAEQRPLMPRSVRAGARGSAATRADAPMCAQPRRFTIPAEPAPRDHPAEPTGTTRAGRRGSRPVGCTPHRAGGFEAQPGGPPAGSPNTSKADRGGPVGCKPRRGETSAARPVAWDGPNRRSRRPWPNVPFGGWGPTRAAPGRCWRSTAKPRQRQRQRQPTNPRSQPDGTRDGPALGWFEQSLRGHPVAADMARISANQRSLGSLPWRPSGQARLYVPPVLA